MIQKQIIKESNKDTKELNDVFDDLDFDNNL